MAQRVPPLLGYQLGITERDFCYLTITAPLSAHTFTHRRQKGRCGVRQQSGMTAGSLWTGVCEKSSRAMELTPQICAALSAVHWAALPRVLLSTALLTVRLHFVQRL